jgi:hypothetical protein
MSLFLSYLTNIYHTRGEASGEDILGSKARYFPDASPLQPSTFISAIAQPTSAPYKGGENN